MQKNYCNYPVALIEDAFGESSKLADALKAAVDGGEPGVLIVADYNAVQRISALGARIGRYVNRHGIRLAGSPIVLPGGEKVKSDGLQSPLRVMSAILDAKLGKRDLVLALGGGSVLDVAGYAAAQVRDGVRVVRMPTTPAAMLDAAFSGRSAVNSPAVKDAFSVSSSPAAVILDPTLAESVLDGVWFGGFAEAVRLALMRDASLFRQLTALSADYRSRQRGALSALVQSVMAVRQKKPPTDLAEWVAIRLESRSGYKLAHGHAVTLGLLVELAYAVDVGMLKSKDREAVIRLLDAAGALDGVAHFQYLFNQVDSILVGLDAWRLRRGTDERELPVALGKCKSEGEPRREVYTRVLNFGKISAI